MNEQRAKALTEKYNAGVLTPAEEAELEELIGQGLIRLEDLNDLREMDERLDLFFGEERIGQMRAGFYERLDVEKRSATEPRRSAAVTWLGRLFTPAGGLHPAYGLLFLILGTALGYLLRGEANRRQAQQPGIAELSNELRDMRETMMLALLKRESTADRLKAVNLTQEMDEVTESVSRALLQTLNQDPNINVRLAALDALAQYARDPAVRRGLIRSIANQESPLVQMGLAEVMVALQERKSVEQLRELLDRGDTAPEVKEKIRQSIEILM